VTLSRRAAVLLVLAGLWPLLIWPNFVRVVVTDDRAFDGGPTAYLLVHAGLAVVSMSIGLALVVLGVRAWRRGCAAGAAGRDREGRAGGLAGAPGGAVRAGIDRHGSSFVRRSCGGWRCTAARSCTGFRAVVGGGRRARPLRRASCVGRTCRTSVLGSARRRVAREQERGVRGGSQDTPTQEANEMARALQITFDCADPAALAAFWADVLGYRVQDPPPGFGSWDEALAAMGVPPERRNDASAVVDPDGAGPRLFFQRVPEGKQGKKRVHLDVRAAPGLQGGGRMAALEDEAARLVQHGATRLQRHEPQPPLGAGHIVMADPEGNEFCLD
jgi:catechol 2,3-dioxygenase-like lactoylglutathione lyase family enzyme